MIKMAAGDSTGEVWLLVVVSPTGGLRKCGHIKAGWVYTGQGKPATNGSRGRVEGGVVGVEAEMRRRFGSGGEASC